MEVSIASFMDAFPQFEKTRARKFGTYAVIFVAYLFGGLIFCLNSGTYWIEIFNTNAGGWAILLIGTFECLTVAYAYGMKNIRRDINCMLGDKYTGWVFYLWYGLWAFISPVLMIVSNHQPIMCL
jgi:SNF family Na+-dependent transporter